MALKFTCSNCGATIVVRFLRPGEAASCPSCKRSIMVPEDAVRIDGEFSSGMQAVHSVSGGDRGSPRTDQAEGLSLPCLRPRTFGGVLAEAWRVYARHFALLMAISTVPGVASFVGTPLARHLFSIVARHGVTMSFTGLLPFWLLGTLLGIGMASIYVFAAATIIHLISQRYATGGTRVKDALAFAGARFRRFFLAHLVAGAGSLLLAAPAATALYLLVLKPHVSWWALLLVAFLAAPIVYVWVRWIFVGQVVLLENCSPVRALYRSAYWTRGCWWRIFGTAMLVLLILCLTIFILSFLLGSFGSMLERILSVPVLPIIYTLLYFDVRAKKESYGHEALALAIRMRGGRPQSQEAGPPE